MNDKKHPAIAKLQSTYGHVSKRLCKGFNAAISPPPPSQVIWKPKNPSIEWPTMVKEETLTREEWLDTGFPYNPLPDTVVGVLNTEVWRQKIRELLSIHPVDHGLVRLMNEVLTQLSDGASSHVEPPGTETTKCPNWFHEPEIQLPRVVDALASWTKGGHLAGPLFHLDENKYKVNPIMAVSKPGGHVRVVGNLKGTGPCNKIF